MDGHNDYPALSYMLKTGRLFPEEEQELRALFDRLRHLEQVEMDAADLINFLSPDSTACS